MLLGLLYCPGERSSCRIKCSKKIIAVYILLVIVNSATSSSWRNQRRQNWAWKNRNARCLKYKHKWDHMPMIPARAPVWLPSCSQTHRGCIFWSEWWQQQNLWLCHVFKDHRRLRALWIAAHTHRVGTKQISHHAFSGGACQPSSGSCHLRSDSYSVILPPSKLQECMDPFTHCAAVKQAVFTSAIFVLAALMLTTCRKEKGWSPTWELAHEE